MYEGAKKDICKSRIDYSMISLISQKVNIGVIGSGRAGIIKAKHFLKENCNVFMITIEKENKELKDLFEYKNFNISYSLFENEFLLDKHIIIIAVNDNTLRERIKEQCDKLAKIYIDCTDFTKGLAVVPVQKNTNNMILGINTIGGNPKGIVFVAEKIFGDLVSYDEYIAFTTKIRNKIKDNQEIKKEVIDFISSEDFYFFFTKGKGIEILKLFYLEV